MLRLKARIDSALAEGRLDPWQARFLADIAARIRRHGAQTQLTEFHLGTIRKIIGIVRPQAPISGGGGAQILPFGRPRRRQQKRRRGGGPKGSVWRAVKRWLKFGWLAALLLAGYLIYAYYPTPVAVIRDQGNPAAPPANRGFKVIDGDTIRFFGDEAATRLLGFNAPDSRDALCEAERQLSKRATQRLKDLVGSAKKIRFQSLSCGCELKKVGTRACNFGRSCGHLRVDGVDVGWILINEGLAVRYSCYGKRRCPPRPRPWC